MRSEHCTSKRIQISVTEMSLITYLYSQLLRIEQYVVNKSNKHGEFITFQPTLKITNKQYIAQYVTINGDVAKSNV